MRDGWRLASGTLTALPTPPPSAVNGAVARACVLLAPLAVWPLAAAVAVIGAGAVWVSAPPLVAAFLCIAALALGTRVLHWDGLSDTVDGLTASYDRERSLAVMKSGTSGPAGVVATVSVAGIQAAALAALLTDGRTAMLSAVAVLVSRSALSLTCRRGVAPARTDGLGHPLAGVVPAWACATQWILATAALTAVGRWAGLAWWQPAAATAVAALSVLVLVRHVTRRLGGVTGDVYGAGVEICLAALLVGLSI